MNTCVLGSSYLLYYHTVTSTYTNANYTCYGIIVSNNVLITLLTIRTIRTNNL